MSRCCVESCGAHRPARPAARDSDPRMERPPILLPSLFVPLFFPQGILKDHYPFTCLFLLRFLLVPLIECLNCWLRVILRLSLYSLLDSLLSRDELNSIIRYIFFEVPGVYHPIGGI
ncbi:hypothetical protein BDV23DRAFT_56309 [Aspergillus alliaceus]|uniref:Uncharacterized protein n=1 Tax=Petromyces alliaceus TaxID=209559 RepID=A0A5N7CDL8_PETAA|nr:hypothetical protein BDV23DRAFT_56309 [Aspergillus alliaceus]